MPIKEFGTGLLKRIQKARYAYPTKMAIDLSYFQDKRDALSVSFTRNKGLRSFIPALGVLSDMFTSAPAIGISRKYKRVLWALLTEAYGQAFRNQKNDSRFTQILYPETVRMNRFDRNDLVVFYRFYEKNGAKPRPAGFDKFTCFSIFSSIFKDIPVFVFMDNSSAEAKDTLLQIRPDCTVFEHKLGNAGNLLKSLEFAGTFDDHTIIYLVEDDYIHLPGSDKLILEAFNSGIAFDYLTLYDHPDKYIDGYNKYVDGGGEVSKVFFTGSVHWKETNSTTMTFAATAETIKKDRTVFERFCKSGTPRDFKIFTVLRKTSHRRLISSVPGYSSHCETGAETPLLHHKL